MRRILILCALATLAGAAWTAWAWWSRDDCFRQVEQRLRGPDAYDAEIVDEVCDADIEYVYLRERESGGRSLVLSYFRVAASPMFRRRDVPPNVGWLDRTHLLIEIDMVSEIIEQHETANGIQVQTRIGRVLYPRAGR